jgi:hypothetical protein
MVQKFPQLSFSRVAVVTTAGAVVVQQIVFLPGTQCCSELALAQRRASILGHSKAGTVTFATSLAADNIVLVVSRNAQLEP